MSLNYRFIHKIVAGIYSSKIRMLEAEAIAELGECLPSSGLNPQHRINQAWWHRPGIPARR